jgi:hypothetical protein
VNKKRGPRVIVALKFALGDLRPRVHRRGLGGFERWRSGEVRVFRIAFQIFLAFASFARKRQRKSSRGQIIRIHVSPPGMLSKVLNNHVRNLTHANVFPNTNDMHAN